MGGKMYVGMDDDGEWVTLGTAPIINFTEDGAEVEMEMPASTTLGKSFSMDFTLAHPDPDLLGLLTGGALGNPPEPTFAVEMTYPIKRTFWQWLRRKPRQHGYLYIPRARLEE